LKEMIFRMIRFIKRWHIYIGRDPDRVSGDAIILFPLFSTVFFCGFAGLLNIRRKGGPEITDLDRQLGGWFDKIRVKDMQALLAGP